MATRKKQEPSQKYFNLLEDEYADAKDTYATAMQHLYNYLPQKLGEYEFEHWRTECVKWAKAIKVIEKEMLRVKKAL